MDDVISLFVLEIGVDIRRLITHIGEMHEQHAVPVRIDLGIAEAEQMTRMLC